MRIIFTSILILTLTYFIILNVNTPSSNLGSYFNPSIKSKTQNAFFIKRCSDIERAIYKIEYAVAFDNLKSLKLKSLTKEQKEHIKDLELLYNENFHFRLIEKTKNLHLINQYLWNKEYKQLYRKYVISFKNEIENMCYEEVTKSQSIENINLFLYYFPNSKYRFELSLQKQKIENEQQKINVSLNDQEHEFIDPKFQNAPGNFEIYIIPQYEPDLSTYNSISLKDQTINPNVNPSKVHVRGYFKKNGTYVDPHVRTSPNSIKSDNLRFP